MIDLRPVLWGIGLILSLFALAMAAPALVDWQARDPDWPIFLASGCACLFAGQILVFANLQVRTRQFSVRQGILLAVFGWITLALAGCLPFRFGQLHLSFTDAIFESVAGVTATASTQLRHLDHMSPGILLWRALLQWIGGIGVLALSAAVLPDLNVGGMLLFRSETARLDDRLIQRMRRLLSGILTVYLCLTLLLFLLLWIAGMTPLTALIHAMGSISCGGFSSSDQSIGHWHSPAIDWVILLGMALGGAPFILHWQIARGRWRQVAGNSQLRWYLGLILLAALAITLWLVIAQDAKPLPALRHSLFAVTSVLTGTGFATWDWSRWTGFPLAILFLLTFVGGCAGSTSGGLKIFRLQLLLANAKLQLRRLLSPNAVLLPEFDGRPVSEEIGESVLGYLFVYILSFALLAMALSLVGMEFAPALGAAAAALANLGATISPSLGPLASFALLPTAAKWLLAAGMIFGRLEFFLLLALFSRNFWRN